jgi:hypothetical protein
VSDKLELANRALVLLGKNPVSNLDNNSPTALLINQAIKYVLVDGQFSIARRSAKPTSLGDGKYQMPNCLKLLGLKDNEKGYYKYELKGNILHTNKPDPEIEYIADISDSGIYDPIVEECIVSRLAYLLARPSGHASTEVQRLQAAYEHELEKAITSDKQQQSNTEIFADTLIDVRGIYLDDC